MPMTLVLTASIGKNPQDGTCLRATAWKMESTPRTGIFRVGLLRRLTMEKVRLWGIDGELVGEAGGISAIIQNPFF